MLIDPAAIEAAITPRTRAVMPVHLNGHPCEIDAIAEIGADVRSVTGPTGSIPTAATLMNSPG